MATFVLAVLALALTSQRGLAGQPVNTQATVAAAPSIGSFSPTNPRPGDSVTINGTSFGASQGSGFVAFADNGFTWGLPSGSPPLTISAWSNTAITFVVPTRTGSHGTTYVKPGTAAGASGGATVSVHTATGAVSATANLAISATSRISDYYQTISVSPDSDAGCSGLNHVYLSANALAAATPNPIVPGGSVNTGDFIFTWPGPANCYVDGVQPAGQTILMPVESNVTELGLLGVSAGVSGGVSSGTLKVNYTNGASQSVPIGFGDWCSTPIAVNNTRAATTLYRNNGGTKDHVTCYVFLDTITGLDQARTVKSITLPSGAKVVGSTGAGKDGSDGGQKMRIFAIALNGKSDTSTSVSSDDSTSVWGQPVTFTATVASAGGSPSGTVQFEDGTTNLGSPVALDGFGNAQSAPVSNLSLSIHSITATYAGSSAFTASSSPPISQVVGKASTATTLTSDHNPSSAGSGVTFTATVTASPPGAGLPTGSVDLKDGTTDLCPAVSVDESGEAACGPIASLILGNHSITATYSGDADFTTSTSDALPQLVADPTTTGLVSSSSTSAFGQAVTFTATVSPTAGQTGTVQFKDGTTDLGAAALLDGTGVAHSAAINGLAVGDHIITATYSGDSRNVGSASSPLTQTVHKAATTIVVNDGDLATHTVVGESYAVGWTVSVTLPGAGTPSGTVTISGGSGCSAAVAAGHCIVTSTDPGSKSLVASYSGDGSFGPSTSAARTHVVDRAATTTSLTSNHNPSVFGQGLTFTATVAVVDPGTGTPTGTVQFQIDGTSVGSPVDLNGSGVAHSAVISNLAVDGHAVTAVYAQTADYARSTGSGLTQTVHRAATSTRISGNHNPSVFGQTVTFTATVSVSSPGSGTPTGSIQFKVGNLNLGSAVALVGGVAHLDIPNLSVGDRSISAVYSGDGRFTGSASSSLTHTVHKAATSVAIKSGRNPSVKGSSIKFTATVKITSPGGGALAGGVQFTLDGKKIGRPITIANGKAQLTVPASKLRVGKHTVTATFGGSATLAGSVSTTYTQTVRKA